MKKVLIILLTLMLIASLSGCNKKEAAEVQAEQERVVAVETKKPEEKNISQSITVSGKLQPTNSVTVIPEIAGLAQVKEVRVKLGDIVRAGDILYILNNESTQDQVENLRLAYETAQKSYEKTKESFVSARLNLERTEKLFKEGAISQQQLEQAQLAASPVQLEALEAQLEQSRFSYMNSLKQLDKSVVTAPISGYVSHINIEEGGRTTAQPSLIITDITSLEVEVFITEGMVSKVTKGQVIDMEIPSVGNDRLKGTLKVINPVPDLITQLYKGIIGLDNSSLLFRPGMFAKIYINMDQKNNVLTIPSVAVIEEENDNFVYVAENERAIKKKVEIGMDNGEIIEIVNGLHKEEDIIVKGQDFIKDGLKVKVVRGER